MSDKVACLIEGCGRPRHARGWCGRHYLKWWSHGDPLLGDDRRDAPTLFGRLLQFLPELSHPGDDCILWPGAKDLRGYGSLSFKGRQVKAHRASLSAHLGRDLDPESSVLHSCDVTYCVNPLHLREGTQGENVADALSRGRWAVGSRSRSAKLTEEIVLDIRTRSPKPRAKDIAQEFGIDSGTASRLLSGQSWKHVKVEES